MKFKELKVGDNVELDALLTDFKQRFTVNQTPYYGVTLSDGESLLDARIWDVKMKEDLTVGKVYHLTIKINDYASKMQAIITQIYDVDPKEVLASSFYRHAPLTERELRAGINQYVAKMQNPILKQLTINLIKQNENDYFTYPAAVSMHHNYLGGLAYHVLSMLKLADAQLAIYPHLNADLLYAGILLHDIGKIKEFSEANTPSYSEEGNLLGHIVIGLQMVAVEAHIEKVSETEEIKALQHLLAAHHGELEFGSPKEPIIFEALALYLIDMMDSKLAPVSDEIGKTTKGTMSNPLPTLNRRGLYVPDLK